MGDSSYLKKELYELIKTDERIFEFIQESALDGMWYWDLENPEKQWMNPKFWNLLGYCPKEMAHKSCAWQETIYYEDLKLATESLVENCKNNDQPFTQNIRYLHKNGSIISVKCLGLAIRNPGGQAIRILGVQEGITDEHKKELQKADLSKRLNYALDASGDGIWDWTPANGVTVFSKAWVEMLGYKMGDLPFLATEWSDRLHPEDKERVFAEIAHVTQSANNGNTFSHEYRFRNKEGDFLWILNKAKVVERNDKGEATRVVGTHTNITEQKSNQLKISQSEQKKSAIIKSMGDLFFVLDKDLFFTEILNPEKTDLYLTPENFLGKSFESIGFPEPAFGQIKVALLDCLQTNDLQKVRYYLDLQPGRQWFDARISSLKDQKGTTTGLTCIVRNVSEEVQKEAEIALISKEIKDITNAVNESSALATTDPKGILLTVNQLFCELSGYTEADLVGQDINLVNSDYHDKAFWQDMQDTIRSGRIWKGEIKKKAKDGASYWVFSIIQPIINEFGQIEKYLSIWQDITERKSAELELENTKDFLNQTNQVAQVGGWDFNLLTSEITWTNTTCEIYGLPHGYKPSYEKLPGFYTPESWNKLKKAFEKSIEDGTPYDLEIESINAENKLFWIRAIGNAEFRKGKCVRLFGVTQNINEKKIAELEMQETGLRLSLATQVGGVGVWDWDIPADILNWDDQLLALYGIKREHFVNSYQTWVDALYKDDKKRGDREIQLALKGEKDFNTEFRVQQPKGNIKTIKALATVIRDHEGKALRMIGVNWDITQEKQALRQIEEAKEQAEKASKAKSEFLANMSHEIRTPLNGVIGFTDLLKGTPLSAVQQQYVSNANISAHSLLGIINDILDFSKIEAGMLELEEIKTDMLELLEHSIDIVKFTAEDKNLELILDIDSSMPRFAKVDPIRIKQVLANLLGNAVKFTQKGEVELKVNFQSLKGKQGKLSFIIRDTGIGISKAQKEKLFLAFSQGDTSTTREFGGTGLGLVISEMIAEKMGSKIHMESTVAVGTTFHFDIQCDFETEEKPDPSKLPYLNRCLIIDDNASNRSVLAKMLSQWQIPTEGCENGFEALKKLESSNTFDLIICDYDMPYMSGIDTIRMMKDKLNLNTKSLPVILIHSTVDDDRLTHECAELGLRSQLNKPVKRLDLFNTLCNLREKNRKKSGPKQVDKEPIPSKTNKEVKILMAEDVQMNMILAKAMLAEIVGETKFFEAKNGVEAVAKYKSIQPDLIFMDAHMPELDGISATEQIRKLELGTARHTPIIALTAGALKEEMEKCFKAGMDDFLAKPLDPKKMELVLKNYFPSEKENKEIGENLEVENEVHVGYDDFAKGMGCKMETVQKLLTKVLKDTPSTLNKLEHAWHQGDTKRIYTIAHSIKGWSSSMRFYLLADIAAKIESDAERNYLDNLEGLLKELHTEWTTVERILSLKMK